MLGMHTLLFAVAPLPSSPSPLYLRAYALPSGVSANVSPVSTSGSLA